jgi:hypothetical protein
VRRDRAVFFFRAVFSSRNTSAEIEKIDAFGSHVLIQS